MNWKLILSLSLFGLAMGVATVFWIPSNVEPWVWLVIFAICAYLIVTNAQGKFFGHGLLVGIANSVWITSAHLLLFDTYAARHPQEIEASAKMMPDAPRLLMLTTGPVIGVISGLILGLFAIIAARIVRKP